MARAFLEGTQQARIRHTQLYDFIWPSAVAMWNLRWQVLGYLTIRPDAKVEELHGRFNSGSGIVQRAHIVEACIDQSWEDQMARFAEIILINLFSIHECWCRDSLDELGVYSAANEKALQYPTKAEALVNKLTATKSPTLSRCFGPALEKNRHYDPNRITNLLTCYRFFKELRNSLAHAGGAADSKAKLAYDDFAKVATKANLGVSEVPRHNPVEVGSPIRLDLRGVVGFGQILLKLMHTFDAQFAGSVHAESTFKKRWARCRLLLPAAGVAEARVFSKTLARMQLPDVSHRDVLRQWLKGEGLLK